MSQSKPCRYVNGYGHYLPSHELNCKDTTCEGCQPCTHDEHRNPVKHCTARKTCGQHLDKAHPLTCPQCVGRTRSDVTWISRNSRLLTAAAIEAGGVETEAANLAGPAADPFTWHLTRVHRAQTGAAYDDHPEDYHHPLAVLGRWEVLLREHYHQPPTRRTPLVAGIEFTRWTSTVTAAQYVFDHLTTIAQDPDFDWAEMAQEIRDCRSHLEDVLNTAKVRETGAPCPSCAKAPPLVKVYAHWCDRDNCDRDHDITGAGDRWRCKACKASWTEASYRQWVTDDYLDNAPALTATEIHMIYGIKPSTLRTWAQRGQIDKRGRNVSGQQTYDVDAALEQRELTTTKGA